MKERKEEVQRDVCARDFRVSAKILDFQNKKSGKAPHNTRARALRADSTPRVDKRKTQERKKGSRAERRSHLTR